MEENIHIYKKYNVHQDSIENTNICTSVVDDGYDGDV